MFGRESTGIPHKILKEHQDKLMRIPMVPEARSLNLSNCVALVAYEVLRQQKFPNLATEEAIKGQTFYSMKNYLFSSNSIVDCLTSLRRIVE